MNIAILGTRGIPNLYGGFEKCAEELSVRFVEKGHAVTVYSPIEHPFQEKKFKGVLIKKVYCNEKLFKGFGTTLFDALCLNDAKKNNYDIILELGYNPAALFFSKFNKIPLITNMDGLEWKRTKWNKIIKLLSLWLEKRACKRSSFLISDNIGIQKYIFDKYKKHSYYIPYGSEIINNNFTNISKIVINELILEKEKYILIVARLEPENNIEMMIKGYLLSNLKIPLIIVGSLKTKFARYLLNKYKSELILFVGGIYDSEKLNIIRVSSKFYLHGHSVGGTNPSLLEAMGLNLNIISHDNMFNRRVLEDGSYYFRSPEELSDILKIITIKDFESKKHLNLIKIKNEFNWDVVS